MQKKAVRPLCHILEINSKIEHRPECKSQNKRLEENIGINLYNLGLDNDFLGMRTKEKIYMKKYINWTSSKLKTAYSRDTIKKVKTARRIEENINHISDNMIYERILRWCF